jgi:hypothetical protein
MFKEEREESQFEWSRLGDIEAGRPNLGPMVHVAVYRLMQFTLRDIQGFRHTLAVNPYLLAQVTPGALTSGGGNELHTACRTSAVYLCEANR